MSTTDQDRAAPPYANLRVIEIADHPAAEFTGRLLAEMGAEVIKIEPLEGAAGRRIGPFARGREDRDHSLHFWYYNGDKRSVTLDLSDAAARDELDSLLAAADVLISDLQPSQLASRQIDLPAIHAKHPKLIIASVTPFGLTGPWKDFHASDLVAHAAGGIMMSCGYDDHSIPPIRPGGNQAYQVATSFAHIGLLLALIERQNTGRGQIIDVSNHEALAVTVELANPYWTYAGALVQRQTCRHAQPVPTQSALFACGDGRYVYFALVLTETKPWKSLVDWLVSYDMDAGLADEAFLDVAYRQKNFDLIQEVVECFFLINDAETIYREGQARELPIGIVNAPEDLFADPHLRARNFFTGVEHDGLGSIEYPSQPYTFTGFRGVDPKPAPALGEANQVYLKVRA